MRPDPWKCLNVVYVRDVTKALAFVDCARKRHASDETLIQGTSPLLTLMYVYDICAR